MDEFLHLIRCNPSARSLTAKGHEVINAHVKEALARGLIEYAPRKNVGYRLTEKGKAYADRL